MQENVDSNNEVDSDGKSNIESPPLEKDKSNSNINNINNELNEKTSDNKKQDQNIPVSSEINLQNDVTPKSKSELKPKKEIPIEKKPFEEFVNSHLIPTLRLEFSQRGFDINNINLKNSNRPIAGDKCWVVYCEIKDSCNFWLSFEKDDISSSKSISLSKPNQTPSIIESFLIDEKRITLKLIVSRILQRLNGQKLIGIN
tara:strand:+ start:252 stop:851 length:600 start_codon:yes stop_codon:yes gene_type:complete